MARKDSPNPVDPLESRRKLKAVQSLQVLSATPQQVLDDISEILARTLQCDIAAVMLSDESYYTAIGSYGTPVRRIISDLMDEVWPEDEILEIMGFQDTELGQVHPLANGEYDRIVSLYYTTIRFDGHIVGILGTASRSRLDPMTAAERRILKRLARVAEATIKAEATLSRLAAEAFRALERIRREDV